MNTLERFETVAALYARRFGRLAPGKSEAAAIGRDSNSDENREQFDQWVKGRLAFEDALSWIVYLRKEIKGMSGVLDSLQDRLNDLVER